jgi:hypothetical protein
MRNQIETKAMSEDNDAFTHRKCRLLCTKRAQFSVPGHAAASNLFSLLSLLVLLQASFRQPHRLVSWDDLFFFGGEVLVFGSFLLSFVSDGNIANSKSKRT